MFHCNSVLVSCFENIGSCCLQISPFWFVIFIFICLDAIRVFDGCFTCESGWRVQWIKFFITRFCTSHEYQHMDSHCRGRFVVFYMHWESAVIPFLEILSALQTTVAFITRLQPNLAYKYARRLDFVMNTGCRFHSWLKVLRVKRALQLLLLWITLCFLLKRTNIYYLEFLRY